MLLSSFYLQTYINHTIYNDLFKYICTAMAAEDAKLNKINRNLSQIQLKDLGIVSEFRYNYKFLSKTFTEDRWNYDSLLIRLVHCILLYNYNLNLKYVNADRIWSVLCNLQPHILVYRIRKLPKYFQNIFSSISNHLQCQHSKSKKRVAEFWLVQHTTG